MAFHDLINNGLGEWMKGTGPGRDVVISSRIRLARNIQGIPFPATASQEQLSHILSLAQSACDTKAEIGTLEFLPMAQISPLERQILVERHLISPQHTQNTAFKGVALRGDQAIS
ncbi:MAG: ATP--guanido phosphotransferase, partial [Limnochordia bacterium]